MAKAQKTAARKAPARSARAKSTRPQTTKNAKTSSVTRVTRETEVRGTETRVERRVERAPKATIPDVDRSGGQRGQYEVAPGPGGGNPGFGV